MAETSHAGQARIPANSLIFGYLPMVPLVAAAIGAWMLSIEWAELAVHLAIIWAAMVLIFIAGVRRGYGFGACEASTAVEIATMLAWFVTAGLALVIPGRIVPLALLLAAFVTVPLLDRRAAFHGDAPAHFARLRPPQMMLAVLSLGTLLAYVSIVRGEPLH